MRLKQLIDGIPNIEVRGREDVEIKGLCNHSADVAPLDLFIAKKGSSSDGSLYIREALIHGAGAILSQREDPSLEVPQLIHPNVSEVEGILASRFFGDPSSKIKVVGVTGTNGKTTSSYLIKHLLDCSGLSCGLLGTIEHIVGKRRDSSYLTTADPITSQSRLREMVVEGCLSAVIEASSHGLLQNRLRGIDFDIAVFTNLSQDHLDYHQTMESYAAAKGLLFFGLSPEKWAIFNADEERRFPTRANIFTYGIEEAADLRAKEIECNLEGTIFTAEYQEESVRVFSPLIGSFNLSNVLGALAVCLCMGISLKDGGAFLKSFGGVPGRMQRVKNGLNLDIFVDYAHCSDALAKVLACLRSLAKRRLIVVFGAGGDRDADKRRLMGKAAALYADLAIITSDNPRSEDPESIASEILEGVGVFCEVEVELDRKKAIGRAIKKGCPGDLILIAGKGHEKWQITSSQTLPFDDVKVAERLCQSREKVCG